MTRSGSAFLALVLALFSVVAAAGQSERMMKIKVYFHSEKDNPNMEDCTKAFPVSRTIPYTTAPATAALKQLFAGTTKAEEERGFSGFPPSDTEGILKNLNVKGGVAFVNFTERLFTQMGTASTSCGGAFFPMVEKTLTQFPTIKRVIYAVDGNTNDFYEWAQVGECPHGKRLCARSNFR
jgi:spore germination protein GerM